MQYVVQRSGDDKLTWWQWCLKYGPAKKLIVWFRFYWQYVFPLSKFTVRWYGVCCCSGRAAWQKMVCSVCKWSNMNPQWWLYNLAHDIKDRCECCIGGGTDFGKLMSYNLRLPIRQQWRSGNGCLWTIANTGAWFLWWQNFTFFSGWETVFMCSGIMLKYNYTYKISELNLTL